MWSEPEGITPPPPDEGDGDGGGEGEADGAAEHPAALLIGHCSQLVPEMGVIVPLNEVGL